MESLLVITHSDCALHHPLPDHPERPERLAAALAGTDPLDHVIRIEAEPVSTAALAGVHSAAYLEPIDADCPDHHRHGRACTPVRHPSGPELRTASAVHR